MTATGAGQVRWSFYQLRRRAARPLNICRRIREGPEGGVCSRWRYQALGQRGVPVEAALLAPL